MSEAHVVLNYDNLPDLESRYPEAVIQPYVVWPSRDPYLMADTVHMKYRPGLTEEQMGVMARKAAPLCARVVIDGKPDGASHAKKTTIFPLNAMIALMLM